MEYFIDLILLFFVFAFIGWCIEIILKYFQFGRFINRGFLMGPWLPIYGSGAVLITVCVTGVSGLESGIGITFVISFIVCGLIEYLTSYFMEKRFHARWWDYSNKPMNLQGRIWIGNLVLFGIGGIFIIHIADPVLYRVFDNTGLLIKEIIAAVLTVVFISDYTISHFVLKLVKAGVETSEADNTEEISREVKLLLSNRSVFYRRFADAYPEVIYKTEKIAARMEEIRNEIEQMRSEAEQRFDEMNRKWDESKAEWNASLEAKKEYLRSNLESTGSIRNNLIKRQGELIDLLYDEKSADPSIKALKEEIDREQARLAERKW